MTAPADARPVNILYASAALLAALVASAGSLWLTLGMELKACPLCLYQRAGVFAAATVLLIGLLARGRDVSLVALLALGPAAMAAGVGAYHNYLVHLGKLECPLGIGEIGTASHQALVAEAFLLVLLLPASSRRAGTTLIALLLGAALAFGLVESAPPMPPTPTRPYEGRFDICRPPYTPPKRGEVK